jgi:hypothetical protein
MGFASPSKRGNAYAIPKQLQVSNPQLPDVRIVGVRE